MLGGFRQGFRLPSRASESCASESLRRVERCAILGSRLRCLDSGERGMVDTVLVLLFIQVN